MKTIKQLIVILTLLLAISCNKAHYKMVTHLKNDGSTYREVYAFGDSAFMAGDLSKTLFYLI